MQPWHRFKYLLRLLGWCCDCILLIPELAQFNLGLVTPRKLQPQLWLQGRHAPRERFEIRYVCMQAFGKSKSRATPELLVFLCTAKVVLPPTARSPATLWMWHTFSPEGLTGGSCGQLFLLTFPSVMEKDVPQAGKA